MKVLLRDDKEEGVHIEARTLKSLADAERFLLEISRAVSAVWPRSQEIRPYVNGQRPWEEAGISKSTYYRRLKRGKL
jgi:hypothetical protein